MLTYCIAVEATWFAEIVMAAWQGEPSRHAAEAPGVKCLDEMGVARLAAAGADIVEKLLEEEVVEGDDGAVS